MAKRLTCMMCGKEGEYPQESNQEFYLCFDCSRFWLTDYLRRLKARIARWWRG
jgi:hypothetical protein